MDVRLMVADDFKAVMGMARMMHQESPTFRDRAFNERKLLALGQCCVDEPTLMCGLVVEHPAHGLTGFFIGAMQDYYFGNDLQACDLALYVLPTQRGTKAGLLLIRAYERWAVAQGACEISLGVSTGIADRRTIGSLSTNSRHGWNTAYRCLQAY